MNPSYWYRKQNQAYITAVFSEALAKNNDYFAVRKAMTIDPSFFKWASVDLKDHTSLASMAVTYLGSNLEHVSER